MKMKYLILILTFLGILTSCQEGEKEKGPTFEVNTDLEIPSEMQAVLDAHGGLSLWKLMRSMTYELDRGESREKHQVDLLNRKVRLEEDTWLIGYDGEEVWVSPSKQAYGGNSARFYHNLLFYFYAMPFVCADPGINYQVLEQTEIQGETYGRIRVSYDNGVGDAPDDEYIICYDPKTKRMEWLLYTVTYFSKEKGKKYNALHYRDWKESHGLLLPETMIGYRTSGDSITEKRYERTFENLILSPTPFDQTIFEMPQEAEIDSLQ